MERPFFKIAFLLSIWMSLTAYQSISHALYIGVVQINHAENSDTSNVWVKVFTDDLEVVLKNQPSLQSYFEEKLQFEINDRPYPLVFESWKEEGEVSLLHFKLACPTHWSSAKVEAAFLMEDFPAQSNVIQLSHGSLQRFCKTNIGQRNCVFEF